MPRASVSCDNSTMTAEPQPWIVLVTGPPAGGKSSLARPLARRLGMPLVGKDELKEVLFDTLGWGDRESSRTLSDASYEVIYHLVNVEVAAGRSLMVEANFREDAATRLNEIATLHPFRAVRVHCFAERGVLLERLRNRAEQGVRHPGHLDAELWQEAVSLIDGGALLEVDGPLIEVDTTQPNGVDVERIALTVLEAMDPA